jgi:hypothetical protein
VSLTTIKALSQQSVMAVTQDTTAVEAESAEELLDQLGAGRISSDVVSLLQEPSLKQEHRNPSREDNEHKSFVDTAAEAPLVDMVLLKRNRLSISPVTPSEWNTVLVAAEMQSRAGDAK